MRHEKLVAIGSLDARSIAAVWPSTAQLAPLEIPELTLTSDFNVVHQRAPLMSAEAAPDVPASVGALIVTAYVALLGALGLATAVPGQSLFAIAISGFFVFMFFAVPAAMFSVRAVEGQRITWDRFMREGLDTFTGRSSGGAALVQMLVVPVSLTLGVLGMGIAIALSF